MCEIWALILAVTWLKSRELKIERNTKNLKDLIECIVVLVQEHKCLATHKKWAKSIFQARSSRPLLQRLPLKQVGVAGYYSCIVHVYLPYQSIANVSPWKSRSRTTLVWNIFTSAGVSPEFNAIYLVSNNGNVIGFWFRIWNGGITVGEWLQILNSTLKSGSRNQ